MNIVSEKPKDGCHAGGTPLPANRSLISSRMLEPHGGRIT
ncbi:hypothetical protein GGQ71_004169 [Rhizobium taibaishanense]|uniref:Uncharacterized protein n=1 Tax=Allorhizobium taibaishanense TaxID=887144 RepID=A0A7W6MW03_9HYPH|nr:hypothetical protein [Allorhizobium taibaishanense]